MKLKLNSDFHDFYDAHFDLDAEHTLSRRMSDGPNKIEAFKLLTLMGIKTPIYGMVSDLYSDAVTKHGGLEAIKKDSYDKIVELVVYTDINAHAGEGKIKVSLAEAQEKYPNHFAVQYIPSDTRMFKGRSERLLQIGYRRIWMEYTSEDNWQSNCGDVNISLIGESKIGNSDLKEIQLPLFAIDFVVGGRDRMAVDLNVSPGLKGTPVQQLIRGSEVVELIKDRMVDICGVPRF
jgi:hypothetical protein